MSADSFLVPVDALRREHDPATFEFECTDELVPLTEFIGQDRALRALQFGLGIGKDGYNIFVTGLTGTGKATAILEHIKRTIDEKRRLGEVEQPSDWCYVYNFDDPDRPNAIKLPAGVARRLRDDLDHLLTALRDNVTSIFASEEYERQRKEVLERGQQEAQQLMQQAQATAREDGFMLQFMPTGITLLPLAEEGRPMQPEEFSALSADERDRIAEKERQVTQVVNEVGERMRSIERDAQAALRALDRQVAEAVMRGSFDAIAEKYGEYDEITAFIKRLYEFALENKDLFRRQEAQQQQAFPFPQPAIPGQPDQFAAFRCNVFVDNSAGEGPPIIVEVNPTWTNLFGRIERKAYLGTYASDHTMLRPGSVHRANGGYLILNFTDVLTRPGAWDGLKRLIRTGEARLEDPMEIYGWFTPQGPRPEPIPVDVKLVVTGDPMSYFLLSAYDEEFWEMFKVKADFNVQIPRNQENALAYAGFICATCQREKLRHFDRSAVARVVEHGSRMVDDQEKLSARFGRLRDLIVEADYWAGTGAADLVQADHVEQAINERIYRLNLVEERIREMIARGAIMVDVEGEVAGQINALVVLQMGDFSFGRPSRITARTFLGQRGIVSIDRESQLSGRIHDKGVLSLSGYLGWKYSQERPMSLSATISFEQGYDQVEGDSASLAELCAVLSSLADAPVRQDLTVTGSVNQKGEVQPIGAVNEKVEGFHDLCRITGFTGTQGVVIPSRNRANLMLRRDVLDSVREGRFHVYAVDTVDQAVEILTGVPAGERGPDGTYPEETINARVHARLSEMSEALRRFARRPPQPEQPEPAEIPGDGQPPEDPPVDPPEDVPAPDEVGD